ncbi:hypothetical protein [Nonomuraea cavernae]|uniref:hypothetical protein n=2 Tax=Nonomuraea cavernae TaxID=2045107 RepID=UPI001666B0DA|nr:hypothetical protein [Nonomuraea cavernae]MCA2186306.1 hypothetical protein [Nonomuraea cavernae]
MASTSPIRPSPGNLVCELRQTWARIEISVGAEYVTLLEDLESGSSRRSIYCPLYPLAEWAAYNWWSLRLTRGWRGIPISA